MFTKIACATDFSEGARAGMMVAARLAWERSLELVLIHAWSPPVTLYLDGYTHSPNVIDRIVRDAQAGLDEAAEHVRAVGVARVTNVLLAGPAWSAVVDAVAADPEIDLVVVGSHGRPGWSRILIGSVAEHIVRHAPCSVLAVRPGTVAASFDHILCPIDFSESSRDAAELAGTLARPGGRGITLCHVVDLPRTFGAGADILAQLDRQLTAQLEEWSERLRTTTPAPVVACTHTGDPSARTLAMIDEDRSIDLVITGSHGRTGLRRLLMGSVSEKLVRRARAPVLVVRRRSHAIARAAA